MADWLLEYLRDYGLPLGAAVLGLAGWMQAEARRRSAERRERAKEQELEDIRRRAQGPYVVAKSIWSRDHPVDVDRGLAVPDSTPANAQLEVHLWNSGETVRAVAASIPESWQFIPELRRWGKPLAPTGILGAKSECLLVYPYDPARRGAWETFRLEFETLTGLKTHHVYETRHGYCEIRRIDPA